MAEDIEGNLVSGLANGRAIKSVDDGLTWSAVTNTAGSTHTLIRVDCNPNSGKFIFVDYGVPSPVYMTDINSDVLKDTSTVFAGNVGSVAWVGNNTWYCAVTINSTVVTIPVLYRSDDDGVTWTAITLQDTQYREYNASGYAMFFDGVDKLIYMSPTMHDFMFYDLKPQSYVTVSAVDTGLQGATPFICVV